MTLRGTKQSRVPVDTGSGEVHCAWRSGRDLLPSLLARPATRFGST
jgi:hypothetical protein